MIRPMILGTRGSELALAQAEMVRSTLEQSGDFAIETRIIKTTGDRRQDIWLRDFSKVENGEFLDKGIFTKELEEALRSGEIDAAVHSLKDVPSELDDGFIIAGVLPRAAVEDVLICKDAGGLAALAAGTKVATGSVRRQRLLERARPDLGAVEIRGNVPTRIRKLVEGEDLGAILLARAGLERLGYDRLGDGILHFEGRDLPVEILGTDAFPPAATQGIVALEIRKDDTLTAQRIAALNDADTFRFAVAERSFLLALNAGCQTPVGVRSWIDEARMLHMKAIIFSEDGSNAPPRTGEVSGSLDEPMVVAQRLFESLT